ncbi:MAG: efflux RND transporter periplasmic adaptor subunit, partial [Geobacteraceae bacterium]|nr:efflux RND transporter periplasmic adaptor subunit [Geobacteraceae bacterium]
YENEFPAIQIGQKVEFSSESYPGVTFSGKVSFIYPFLDPKTRTVKVRVELPNPGGKLKPDMFMRGLIKAPQGIALTVPVTAVLDTGKRQVVWVESKPGIFMPRDVKTGDRSGDRIRILSGLKEGELVAVSGGYLIDSEAQLKGGMTDGHEGHGTVAPEATQDGAATPVPKKQNDLNMDDMKM